jgi:hypothetical protein
MKKIFTLTALLFCAIYSASAQYYYGPNPNNNDNSDGPFMKLGIGISSGATTGPVSNSFPEAGGISLKFEMPFAKSPVSLVLSTGYTFYVTDGGYSGGYYYDSYGGEVDYGGQVASFVPVEAGLKVYLARRFFIEGEAGVSFNVNTYAGDYTNQTTAFIYSPSAGFTLPFGYGRHQSLDLSLFFENRPEAGGGYQQIGLSALWNFGLK